MKKKFLSGLIAVLAVIAGVAVSSAFEAHVINVTAKIENALSVTPEEIPFGTVFPQEKLYKPLTISMSSSFQGEPKADDIEYKIVQKAKFKIVTTLMRDALAGDEDIDVESTIGMEERDWLIIGPDLSNFEMKRIKSIMDSSILLDSPLSNSHRAGETVVTIYEYLCTYISKHPDESPPNDVGVSSPHYPPECMDEIDNDKDGNIDFPADPECASYWDNDEATVGDQPLVFGRLAKSENDYEDIWTIDLVVPCFQGMCAQDYSPEEYGPPLPRELEGKMFGCDLWVEVTGISRVDGSVPECTPGNTISCDTGNPGICGAGVRTCSLEGVWGECEQINSPSAEICDDTFDNDCDGLTDCEDTIDCSEYPACYQPTVLEGWNYRKKLTIDSTKIDSNLSDFPVLVKLTNSSFDFSKARSDGYDIRFTQSDGTTLLKYEREIHDSGNQFAGYWVKVPSIASDTDTEIYLYYGNASASDGADPTNVWDADFAGVWHLKEGDSVVTIEDSTAYNNDLTKKSGPEPSIDEGKIAKAQHFDGTNDYIKGTTFLDGGPSNATFEGWFKPDVNYDSSLASDIRLITKGYVFDLRISADNGAIRNTYAFSTNGTWNWVSNMDTTMNSWTAGSWYKITVVLGSNGREIWVNGTKENTSSETKSLNANTDYDYTLAANFNQTINFFDGIVDESRISFVDRGDAWIKASYHSDNDSLLTFGSEELL